MSGSDEKVVLDKREKAIFWDVDTRSKGSKLYATLLNGLKKPQQAHE